MFWKPLCMHTRMCVYKPRLKRTCEYIHNRYTAPFFCLFYTTYLLTLLSAYSLSLTDRPSNGV